MAKLSEHDKTHMRNLAAIRKRVDRIFAEAAAEAARIGVKVKEPLEEGRIFSFDDYPATLREVEALVGELREQVEVAIVNGVRSAWTLSNNKNNALVSRVFAGRERDLSEEEYRRYFSNNNSALEAFLRRRTRGMDLSDRVWNYSESFRREIEMGIDLGLRSGESAAQMARSLRQYLRAPDKLFRRVRDRHGVLQLSKAAGAYHPGRGVYRSSYKNALRLAATETNMAYRTADHLRWQQLDFVVGIEIRLSNNHTLNGARFTDICDTLAGRYPKDFKFTGWHPMCRCHAVTVLKTEAEMAEDTRRILAGEAPVAGSANAVREVPAAFREWVEGNAERISAARQRGTLPYFLRDNGGYLGGRGAAGAGGGGAAGGDKGGIVERGEYPETSMPRTMAYLGTTGIEKIYPRQLENPLSTEEIIDKVGGADPKLGACTSLAFAYAGNRAGFDVKDFRGGKSCFIFQRPMITDRIFKEAGGVVLKNANTMKSAQDWFEKLNEGEEYIFASPHHTAVVRKHGGRVEYLELQGTKEQNGFKRVSDEVLRRRFGCEEKALPSAQTCALISIEQLRNCKDFQSMLQYLNTQK